MRLYQNLLLALAFLVAVSSMVSAQSAARSLRTGTTDEERGIIDKLSTELSFLKLNRAARQKMTPEEKLIEKQAKATAKRAADALKAQTKAENRVTKALKKQADQVAKSEKKVGALKTKQLEAMSKLKTKEMEKQAKALAKQDGIYNRWLVANKKPDEVEAKFQPGFDSLAKRGIDPTTSENFKHLENYWTVYYNRYPELLPVALKTVRATT
ncbi:hypothetical protein V7S43_017569 [Phytophthora oleae]|uniref:RxLR effector protein n=1 Tax=Phytophthora oleae TaxID=2107226 RepID=A0ABD3ESZ2_9STRA